MIRWLVRALVAVIVLLPIAAIVLAWLALDQHAVVADTSPPGPAEVERAQRLFERHDPRRARAGVLRTLRIGADDLTLMARYAAARRGAGGVKIALGPGTLHAWVSAGLPANPVARFVNLEIDLRETATLPTIERMRVGRVPVPAWLARYALARALARIEAAPAGDVAHDVVRRVAIDAMAVTVEYRWRDDLPAVLARALVSEDEVARLRAWQARLVQAVADPALGRRIALSDLMTRLARAGEGANGSADPAADNRALLITLAFYVNGKGVAAVVPAAAQWPRAETRKVTLAGRDDLALHFAISAAIAATAGGPLADAIGLYKEIDDARHGSGFSFVDALADRSGTLLGECAVGPARTARELKARLATGVVEAELLPPFADLPEGLSAAEFERGYGGMQGARTRALLAEIERRLARLALYR